MLSIWVSVAELPANFIPQEGGRYRVPPGYSAGSESGLFRWQGNNTHGEGLHSDNIPTKP
jgi:hypothetical protein